MPVSREKEVSALALWVEKHHGSNHPRYIAEQIGRLALAHYAQVVDMWRTVAERFVQLSQREPWS